LFCPWNKFAKLTDEPDFAPRHKLDSAKLVDLFSWDEDTWLGRMEGSAIRRIGHEQWMRNIAVALGNAKTTPEVVAALKSRQHGESDHVAQHVDWALAQHEQTELETDDV